MSVKNTVIGAGIGFIIWRIFGGFFSLLFLIFLFFLFFGPEPDQSEIRAEQQRELKQLERRHDRLVQFQHESDEYAKPLPDKPFRKLVVWRSHYLEALERHISEDYSTEIIIDTYSRVMGEIQLNFAQEELDKALYHIRDLVAFLKRTSFNFTDKAQKIKILEYQGNKLERLMRILED